MPTVGPPIDPARSLAQWNPAQTKWNVPILRGDINAQELAKFKGDYFAHVEYRREWGRKKQPIPPKPSAGGQSS